MSFVVIIVLCERAFQDRSHLTTTMWNFTSSGISAAPIPDDKKMGCMVTNLTVHTWQHKKWSDDIKFPVVVTKCERFLRPMWIFRRFVVWNFLVFFCALRRTSNLSIFMFILYWWTQTEVYIIHYYRLINLIALPQHCQFLPHLLTVFWSGHFSRCCMICVWVRIIARWVVGLG